MWDKKLKNRTIKKKLSRWMTVVCSFLLAVGLGFSVGSAAAEYFPESRETQAQTKAVQTKKVSVGGMPAGIYMETDGVLILDTQQIKGIDGIQKEIRIVAPVCAAMRAATCSSSALGKPARFSAAKRFRMPQKSTFLSCIVFSLYPFSDGTNAGAAERGNIIVGR